jgi:deazaflavin-dependent oxidoreductase (nitroreductase family)
VNDFNAGIVEQFRTGDAAMVGPFPRSRLVVLHTVGARTGARRETPLMSFPAGGDDRFVVASKAGAPDHPAWFHNILADPDVAIETAADGPVVMIEVLATVLQEPERSEVYTAIAAQAPAFADYAERTDRAIPVVRLSPR